MINFDPSHAKIHGAMLRGQYLNLDGVIKQDEFLGNDTSAPASIVSCIDVDRSPPMNMDTPMSDMCPECGGNCMRVGDYVCWGRCFKCYEAGEAQIHAAIAAQRADPNYCAYCDAIGPCGDSRCTP